MYHYTKKYYQKESNLNDDNGFFKFLLILRRDYIMSNKLHFNNNNYTTLNQ